MDIQSKSDRDRVRQQTADKNIAFAYFAKPGELVSKGSVIDIHGTKVEVKTIRRIDVLANGVTIFGKGMPKEV